MEPVQPAADHDLSTQQEQAGPLFGRPALLWWALISLIFVVGLGVRLYRLSDPLEDFHPTRQLHSALIARGMYAETNAGLPAWQREMAVSQWRMEGLIEPQVFERLVAWTYPLTGGPHLAVPRLYAVLFWMVAAVFLTILAADFAGWGGALVAALFFLAWPYGVTASRAFMPEPLMIALLAAGLWAALRWQQGRASPGWGSWGWAVTAGLLSGLAIYIKSVALFFIVPALAALVLSPAAVLPPGQAGPGRRWHHLRRVLLDPQVWVLAGLAALPYIIYLIDGVVLHRYLVGQFSLRFFPQMWLDPAFYLRWISNLGRALPFEMVLVALLGAFLARRPGQRALLLAMWVGYFVYGMALPHHISTHDYYHLPLFPVVGLGLGSAAETLFNGLRGPRWLVRLAAVGLLLSALVINVYDARTAIKRSGAPEQAAAWQEIGQALGPGASVVALVDDYGSGLKYWGWINPAIWPTADDISFRASAGQDFDFASFFNAQVASKDFFVVALFDELDRQPELGKILAERYPVLRETAGYRIYDLRAPRTGQGRP
jgi:4-amino-4-deoxy-L-arabinose transferase-like glycosyltransferase